MSSPEGAPQPPMLQSPAAMVPNIGFSQQTTRVGLANWPSIKYEGFFAFHQAWPSGANIPERPPPTANIQEALSPMRESHPSPDVTETNESVENGGSTPAAESQCPLMVKGKTSDSEQPAAMFTTPKQMVVFGSHEFQFSFGPRINNAAVIPAPKFSPVIPDARTTPSNPTYNPPASQASGTESPYNKMRVYKPYCDKGTSRKLAKSPVYLQGRQEDRIMMFTDGSAQIGASFPKTAAVTYRRSYDGINDQSVPWIDLSYGVIGVEANHQAEVIAMVEALEVLEQEVRSYAKAKENDPGSELRVLIFSDSDVCLRRLYQMIEAPKSNGPYTGRDWTFECLKAKVKKLGKFINSTDLKLRIEFRWVKGHSGVEGNERADRLASAVFPTACSYFSAQDLASYKGKGQIVEMKEMSRILDNDTPDPLIPALLADKPSLTTGTTGELGSETDESSATTVDTELATGCSGLTTDAAVLREIDNLRQEVRDHRKGERKRERRRSNKMASKLVKAAEERMGSRLMEVAEEMKNISLVPATPVDDHAVVDSAPKKRRKRDVLIATFRQAKKRLRGKR